MAAAAAAGLVVMVALLAPRAAGPALGQGDTTVQVVSPDTAEVDSTVAVQIRIENVTNLGSYEWFLTYDPTILELAGNPVNGDFLGSSGRSPQCPEPIVDAGTVRFGCGSSGYPTAGPTGSGLLSTVTFTALVSGSSSLCLSWASLSDATLDVNDIPAGVVNDSIAVGGGLPPEPACAPAATPTQGATATPVSDGNDDETDETPEPTATTESAAATATPAGPTPTPAPTPPPDQAESVDLAALCNPVTITYPDGTTVQTLTAAIAPPGILTAMWKFQGGTWLGYSPQFPQASDLATTAFLDVVFLCTDAAGTFVRVLV